MLGFCYVFYFMSMMQRNLRLVSGWAFSPFATKTTTTTTMKRRTETKPSIHKKWQRKDLLFSVAKSRLSQDFTDGDSDYNNFSEDGAHFDDFDDFADFADFDFVVGDDAAASNGEAENSQDWENSEPDSSSPISILQQRFQKVALTEQVNRQQISDNWKDGFWGVWGCSLDPYAQKKTFVTCIRLMQPSQENDDGDDSSLLIVGRSDGSICWLQMETLSSPSSSSSFPSTSPSDNDPKNNVENRSVTTYFENKLVAEATDDGGLVVNRALQRRENDGDTDFGNDDGTNRNGIADGSSPRLPFDILAQIQTAATTSKGSDTGDTGDAIVDMLPLPSAKMLWTISHGAPNTIQGWKLVPHSETGSLLPETPLQSPKFDIETIHTSPIVAMKTIPKSEDCDDSDHSFVVSVSNNGQVIVWEITAMYNEFAPAIRIRLDANLLQQQEEEYAENDSLLSIDVDDQYLYLGSRMGKISIFSWSTITEKSVKTTETSLLRSLPLVKQFLAFTSKNPGVSTLLAAGPGTLGATNNGSSNSSSNRPPTKTLIAGDMSGGLKQWDLIPAGKGRLEHWPRLASQKLTGGKPHVYETRDHHSFEDSEEGENTFSPAITELLRIQQVLLAATGQDLTVWDSSTGKKLYDMQGLDFTLGSAGGGTHENASHQRPSLIAANDSVLVTNGMENFVCVHDFTMNRITSENVQDFLEQDRDDDGYNGGND